MDQTSPTAGDPKSPEVDRPGRSTTAPDLGASFVVTADVGVACPNLSSTPSGPAARSRSSGAASPEGLAGLPPFELRALRIASSGWGAGWELRPAPPRRAWMDQHTHAYHCLPLVVANQWGWQVHFPVGATVVWDGSPDPSGVRVEVESTYEHAIKSQFGQGIVTFSPPWLFRTPPGWDLFAKGPANHWKPNCVPLEGIIETWWLPYTFTFNWKLVEPGAITFEPGECIGHLLPIPHQSFAEARAIEEPLGVEPELAAEMAAWRDERNRRAGQRMQNHLMYRKAQDVNGHLVRVPVPPVGPRA